MGEDPYVVDSQPNLDVPVFVIHKEGNTGVKRTLHRNHLLPIGHLTPETPQSISQVKPPVPRPRRKRKQDYSKETRESFDRESSVQPEPSASVPTTIVDAERDGDTVFEITIEHHKDAQIPTSAGADASEEGGENVEEADRDTSLSDDDHQPQEETEDKRYDGPQAEEQDITDSPPEPDEERELPRRSARPRRPPDWQTSGEFVMAQQNVQSALMQKIIIISDLIKSGAIKPDIDSFVKTLDYLFETGR